ncbi:MAG: hypothetical protein PHD41_06015 [Methanosarcinaceae archaeon]|nr:hypothetical protein [Methanosarcinaceae archaeon]MDD4749904.1 hypothetical protein [Methanosarcinaceae archaeon]
MGLEKDIFNQISEHFIYSRDFNGVLALNLSDNGNLNPFELKEILTKLVYEKKVTLTFSSISENPHIKRFPDLPIDEQINHLNSESLSEICVYPSPNILANEYDSSKYDDRPFSKLLFLGKPQLKAYFFDITVLESYFQDPRYLVMNHEYRGSISITNEYYKSEEMPKKDKIVLENFGIGYTYKEEHERVVVGLLRYLSRLSPEHQQVWLTYQRNDKCFVEPDYTKNIMGGFATHVSIYKAFLEEIYHINEISKLINRQPLFKNSYKDSKPKDFTCYLRPTRNNYHNFVHLLDKMLSENINKNFFNDDILLTIETERKDGKIETKTKGTISMLDEWLRSKIFMDEDTIDKIIGPIKRIRKERQKPAHKVQEDNYDKKYFQMQNELINSAYNSVRTIRLLFMNHPLARNYEIPNWLYEGKIKIY